MKNLLFLIFICIPLFLQAQLVNVSSGTVIRHANFPSEFVDSRHVDVWLPDEYSDANTYAVLYMHDGQMLFDASTTWNKQEWGIDEVMSELIKQQKIRDCIIVGIWNNGNKRHAEYFPQRAWSYVAATDKTKILNDENIHVNVEMFDQGLLADNYLRFLVQELKPFIDSTYSTFTDKANTFVMGSSMGGLISLYAISEYPGIFKGAVCMSTHWPAAKGVTLYYVADNLPNPNSHKIYFDFGTATLDSLYEPYQLKVDAMMLKHGFVKNNNFKSLKFDGAAHSENAWKERLHIPLEYMLKADE